MTLKKLLNLTKPQFSVSMSIMEEQPNVSNQPIQQQPLIKKLHPLTTVIIVLGILIGVFGIFSLFYSVGTNKGQNVAIPPSPISPATISQPSPAPFFNMLKSIKTTGQWSTYIINNPIIGNFSIEIPNNWYVFDIPNFQAYITNSANFEDYYFSRITPSGHDFFIISYAQDHRGPITDDFKSAETVEQITINGMSATKAINKNGQFGKEETVVFRKPDSSNDYLYFIYKFGDQKIFNQILSTFQFSN